MGGITTLQVGSLLSYLIAFAVPCLDAVLPVLPAETVIIAFGVATAGSADPRIFLLVLCAAVGAWAGDNLSYHNMPEIVIHRDTDDDWKRISLVDDYGGKISLSVQQLRSLAAVVLSDEFALITGL